MPEAEYRPYRTRTTALFAAKAAKAVVLRRGPRTHYHLILWDTATDTFEPGQWMKGNVILWDLSPSADKLIYFAEQFHQSRLPRSPAGRYEPLRQSTPKPRRPSRKIPRYLRAPAGLRSSLRKMQGSWTAVSTPPYLSALAIWPSYGRWTGGGLFLGERDIALRETPDGLSPCENVPTPATVRIRPWTPGTDARRRSAYDPCVETGAEHAALVQLLLAAGLKWVDWINIRHDDMLFAGDGRIFRAPMWRSIPPKELLATAKTLADLRDMSFQLVRAPAAAMRW